MRNVITRVVAWWFEPMARGRVAALRTLVYGFIFIDVFLTTAWVARHAHLPGELYQPLFLARLLNLPVPTEPLVVTVKIVLLVSAAVALTGRFPRVAGGSVFVAYLCWMFIAMSYGKVDHDRFAFLVALAVLPTTGSARWSENQPDEKAGWAVRCIQVAVVLTYFLAAFAKFRFGGLEWVNGATLMRAVIRRGTYLARPLEDLPWLLQITQYVIVLFELASPLLLVPGRVGRAFLKAAFAFHLITYSMITIIFLPHVVCLFSFVPLERLQLPNRMNAAIRRWHLRPAPR